MSLSDRRAFLSVLMMGTGLTMSGCFRPMLAAGGSASSLLGKVSLPAIDGRFGYFLSKSLEDRLGAPAETAWTLSVSHRIQRSDLAVSSDNSVTRITLTAIANWTLRQRSNGAVVLSDQVVVRSGYNATTSLFATRQAKQDIERRLARDIGERIARRIQANAEDLTG